MKNKTKIILLLFFLFSTSILSVEKKKVLLRWNEAPTAISYIIEIRNLEKEGILREERGETSISVELEPGIYERRISIINKLGELEVKTEWEPFKIVLVKTPELDSEKPIELIKDENPVKLELKGKHFTKEMKVVIRAGEKEVPIKNVKIDDENNATVELDPEDIPEGNYDIILKNPRKEKKIMGYVKAKNPEPKEIEEPEIAEKKPNFKKWEIVKRSAMVPGWGEYYAGKNLEVPKYETRGKIYFGAFAFSTLLYLYFNEFTLIPGQKTPTQKKFEQESTTNLAVAFALPNLSNNSRRLAALYGLQKTADLEDAYNTQVQRTNIMLFLMVGIYITQLVDAYFIEKSLDFSFKDSIFQKYQFSMTPGKIGGEMEMNYNFGYTFRY